MSADNAGGGCSWDRTGSPARRHQSSSTGPIPAWQRRAASMRGSMVTSELTTKRTRKRRLGGGDGRNAVSPDRSAQIVSASLDARMRDCDHDSSLSLCPCSVPESFRDLLQRIISVDDWLKLPSGGKFCSEIHSFWVFHGHTLRRSSRKLFDQRWARDGPEMSRRLRGRSGLYLRTGWRACVLPTQVLVHDASSLATQSRPSRSDSESFFAQNRIRLSALGA